MTAGAPGDDRLVNVAAHPGRSAPASRMILAAILVAFVALSVFYNFALPLFEGSDEASHYRLVNAYADQFALPDLNRPPSHEAQQPPLYYALCAPLIQWIDRGDFQQVFYINPNYGREHHFNLAPTDLSPFPTGTTLAVRICRLVSSVLGALSVLLVYATAKCLLQQASIALLAAGLTAFNPTFIHLSSVVSNDIAVVCAGMLALWLAARVLTRPGGASLRSVFALGAAVGITTLSKYSGFAVVLPAGFAILWQAFQPAQGGDRRLVRSLLLPMSVLALGFALTAGWLFAYQYAQYGHPLAWQQVDMLNAYARRAVPLDVAGLLEVLPRLGVTYWGGFGAGVEFPAWVDTAFAALLGLAVAGIGIALVRKQLPGRALLLAVAILASLVALASWAINYSGTENSRLLGPVYGAAPILAAAGLLAWLPRRSQFSVAMALCGGCALWALAAPFVSLIPAYAGRTLLPPEQRPAWTLSDAQVAALPSQSTAPFENGIELLYASLDENRIDSGDEVRITFYWRVNQPLLKAYYLVIEAFDDQGISILHLSRPPLDGRWPTVAWNIGDVLRDEQVFTLSADKVDAPSVARVYVGWYEYDPPMKLVRLKGSDAVSTQVAEIKIRAGSAHELRPTQTVDASFAGLLALEGYDISGDTLKLYWRSLGEPDQNYTVFVHGLDAGGNIIAQQDIPFDYAAYLWDQGEQVVEQHDIPNLSRAVTIRVGVYKPATGERLTAARADGEIWPDSSVLLKLPRE